MTASEVVVATAKSNYGDMIIKCHGQSRAELEATAVAKEAKTTLEAITNNDVGRP